MIHRGSVIADRLGLRGYPLTPGVGGSTTFYWDPRQHGGRLILDLSDHTYDAAPSELSLKLEPTYTPTDYEELELVYLGYGRGPITITGSGTDGLCIVASAAPDLAAAAQHEVIRLQYLPNAPAGYRVVDRKLVGYTSLFGGLDILDSILYDHMVSPVIHNVLRPFVRANCGARMDVISDVGCLALLGGHQIDTALSTEQLLIGLFDGATVIPTSVPTSSSSVVAIHMYDATRGLAGVSAGGSTTQLVLVTANGGSSWTWAANLPFSQSTISRVVGGYRGTTRVIAAQGSPSSNVALSETGGATWVQETIPSPGTVRAITHSNVVNKSFIAVGNDGSGHGRIWRRDAAAAGSGTWSVVYTDGGATTTLWDVRRDMAVGDSGTILYTTDGGATWTPRSTLRLGPGGYVPSVRRVVYADYAYYVFYRYDTVGHVGISLNSGKDFFGGVVDRRIGFDSTSYMDRLGPDRGGRMAVFPTGSCGFSVLKQPPIADSLVRLQ